MCHEGHSALSTAEKASFDISVLDIMRDLPTPSTRLHGVLDLELGKPEGLSGSAIH